MNNVTSPQSKATKGLAVGTKLVTLSILPFLITRSTTSFITLPLVRSPTAFPASDKPITATVGPITAAGITLSIQFVPTYLTINEIAT